MFVVTEAEAAAIRATFEQRGGSSSGSTLGLDINTLTLIVSLEAIYLCAFLLMSGNRQSERDRHQAEADYMTNVLAERNIEALQRDIARIENDKLDTILSRLPEKSTPARKKSKASRK